ncbi:MAG: nitroreductase [Erysipelotrichaceae bacterium]|nr:nitroreductase [Erysipelotrichaceae bacterium]
MDIIEAMKERHSVRNYLNKPLAQDVIDALQVEIANCNQESGLHIQLVINEPQAFQSRLARYGKFSNVSNYIVMAGPKSPDLDELCGYYGERLVLKAQMLGCHTCWVGLTYKKIPGAFELAKGEKLVIVIALGYGATSGTPHKSKPLDVIGDIDGTSPDWYIKGIEAVALAPTAVNQQKFHFALKDDQVEATPGRGFYTKVDLGIAKYHFEMATNKDRSLWI